MNREEAILAMLEGKEVTSDEFNYPDKEYCYYNKEEAASPFRYISPTLNHNIGMHGSWTTKEWRLRAYMPKDKELVWCWDKDKPATSHLKYYDTKNECTFSHEGKRDGYTFDSYVPFNGTPPPNICKPEDLED